MTKKNSVVEILPRDRKQEFKRQVAQMIEEQVSEALSNQNDRLFQPFFQTREIANEIKRRQTVAEQRKFIYAFEKYGCLCCGTKDEPHQSLWMCARCYRKRHQQLLAVIRENQPTEEPTLRFMDTVQMARASLIAPAVMAVAETKALSSEGRAYQERFTQKEVAEAAGINPLTLIRWLSKGWFEPPETKFSGNRFLWTQDDVQRLKEFAAKRREPRPAKPRPPRTAKLGRPTRVLDQSAIAALRAEGKPWSEIAVILGCSPTTLYKVAAEMNSEKPE